MKALIWEAEALADTVETWRAAFNESFRAFAIDLNLDPVLWRHLSGRGPGTGPLRAYLAQSGHALDDATVAAIAAHSSGRCAALIAAGAAPLRPGAATLLDDARHQHLRQAVFGRTSPAELSAIMAAARHAPVFDVVVPAPEPDAAVIDEARARLRLDRADCLVIASSGGAADAALAAGMDVRLLADAAGLPH